MHSFNGPLSGTTWVSRWGTRKVKANLDFTEARESEWQWHQLGYMQVCTSLQTDNHASTPPLCFYRPDALRATQPTASKHWRNTHSAHILYKLLHYWSVSWSYKCWKHSTKIKIRELFKEWTDRLSERKSSRTGSGRRQNSGCSMRKSGWCSVWSYLSMIWYCSSHK